FAPSRALSSEDCDSLLVTCSWRLEDPDEDRVAIMWDLGNAADGSGTFKDHGCQVACHGSMHPLSGAVDIWQWRAARTNGIQFPFPGSSLRVGFAEDGYADASSRRLDPGPGFYRNNYRYVDCGNGERAPVPLELPIALDANNQPTTRTNDFMRPCEYIYDPSAVNFTACSRSNPCRQFNQEDVETWVSGDDLSGFLSSRPVSESQRQSLHDVEARGRWVGEVQGQVARGVWTLEMSRLLNTGRSEDRSFQVGSAEPYYMALAIMNHAGSVHTGSPVIQVTLRP
ncbi:MAG TPA: ethylbenzene dehydrogenase-related protein, partial [Candidatus Udaeobacter sp.]|nr:ethylbenzene dehydrogenase-related protein [Candidatus Udaeobacter sp.]